MDVARFAFVGGLLIDGTGEDPVQNSMVIVEDKRIAYAGPMMDVSADLQQVDISGKVIMPGLIDTHLHFCGNLSANDSDWVLEPLFQKAICAVAQAAEALENGLTSVGEISRFGIDLRNMIEAGVVKGPRIVAAGMGFCRTGGHGDSHRLPYEYNNASHPWAERVDGPWELRKAVRMRAREGPDAIKIWSTGGGIWRLDRKADQHYTYEEIKAVVDEAAMIGLPVWSHAEGYGGALDSCRAGVAAIIHGQELNEECLEIMQAKDISFCPTMQFFYEWFQEYEPPYRPILDKYPGSSTAEKELNRIVSNLQSAKAKGIRITVGSDSFCSSLTPYGTYAIREIHTLVRSGLSEMEALVAATRSGAEMLRIDRITGTLEAGKFADLLVLRRNPLDSIENLCTENMDVIMKEGSFVRGREMVC